MKFKVTDSGIPIRLSPPLKVPLDVISPARSSSQLPTERELNSSLAILWYLLTLLLKVTLILVAISLTLCDIVDLETNARTKLLNLPKTIQTSLTDWAPRFLVTVIGFMMSVSILILERNANHQSWDAVISLLWFADQISHLPEIYLHIMLKSELFIFRAILSMILTVLSVIILIAHSISGLNLYCRYSHKPRDASSINPSHKELVQSFKENNEIISTPPSSHLRLSTKPQTLAIVNHDANSSPPSMYRNLTIKPDLALRKRLADLSIDKNTKVKHCTTEDEPFDKLLEQLGSNLQAARKNAEPEEVTQKTNWITSGFWSTRCYGNEIGSSGDDSVQQGGMFASFTASWSRFIPDGSGNGIIRSVTQKMVKISRPGTGNKPQSIESYETVNQEDVVKPSKLNLLSQLTYK